MYKYKKQEVLNTTHRLPPLSVVDILPNLMDSPSLRRRYWPKKYPSHRHRHSNSLPPPSHIPPTSPPLNPRRGQSKTGMYTRKLKQSTFCWRLLGKHRIIESSNRYLESTCASCDTPSPLLGPLLLFSPEAFKNLFINPSHVCAWSDLHFHF